MRDSNLKSGLIYPNAVENMGENDRIHLLNYRLVCKCMAQRNI